MSGTGCSAFEDRLAAALGSPHAADAATIAALQRHAAECPECAASLDLVALAAVSVEARDPVDDPGPSHWDDFDRRLRARLERRASAGRSARGWWIGAALAAGVGGVALLFAARRGVPPPPPVVATVRPGSETAPKLPALEDPVREEDDSLGVLPAGVLDTFTDDSGDALFPGTDDLAPADEERFLEWLKAEELRIRRGAA